MPMGGIGTLPIVSDPSGRSTRGSHHIAAFSICEFLGWIKYHLGYSPKANRPPTLRGTLIHLALAYHYASKMVPPPPWFHSKDLSTALEEKGAGLPDGIQKAKEVLLAYREQYEAEDLREGWKPRFVEEEFAATVGELDRKIDTDIEMLETQTRDAGTDTPLRLELEKELARLRHLKTFDDELVTCRTDLIIEKPASPLASSTVALEGPEGWIVDHKSKAKPWGNPRFKPRGLDKWDDEGEFALDWQVLINLHVLRARSNQQRLGGLPIKGFIIQRMTREADAEGRYHFDRHVLKVSDEAYRQTPRMIREAVAVEDSVRRKTAAGIEAARSFWACYGRYGPCDFRAICKAKNQDEKRDILRERYSVEER